MKIFLHYTSFSPAVDVGLPQAHLLLHACHVPACCSGVSGVSGVVVLVRATVQTAD